MPKKSHPHKIDMASPQKNFVEACAINHGEDVYESIYGPFVPFNEKPKQPTRKASGYGHGIGQRAGKLRLSGKSSAHRIGKR